MNSPDNSLRGATKKQGESEGSVRKLDAIMGFLRRNAKRFLVAGLFTVILSVLALAPGIGFAATVDITSSQILVRGHPCYGDVPVIDCDHAGGSSCYCVIGWMEEGTANFTFNPCLYPTNHLFGSEVSTKFTRLRKPYVSESYLKESLIVQTLLSEFPINIPLFYAVCFILATQLEKAFRKGVKEKTITKKKL